MNIPEIQKSLAENNLDGWLMADFHGRNTVATEMLQIYGHITRRSFYFIPVSGEPVALIHAIEKPLFKHLPGVKHICSSYRTLEEKLKETVAPSMKLAMEYSPNGRLPYIGLVDAGTIELVRSIGCEILSSENLVAKFQAILDDSQIESHKKAAVMINKIKDDAFALIKDSIENSKSITEFDVVSFILEQFEKNKMETDHSPICGVNGNAGNPHYEPIEGKSSEINRGDLILIDLWAKLNSDRAVFADITWMAFAGKKSEIPEKFTNIFWVITGGRNAAVDFLNENLPKRDVVGGEVDDICRNYIKNNKLDEYFVHRTGHSITTNVHGTGPNIDNMETEDSRILQKGHLFSIEPGVYMEDCGFRTEIDVLIGDKTAEIHTQPIQTEILALF